MAEESQTKKRRLRGNTDTVRERTVKIQEQQSKKQEQSATGRALRSFWWGFTWPLRQLARPLRWLGRFRVVRIIGRIVFPRYFRNSWRELRLVTWPNWRKSWRLTYAVIVFSVIFGAIIFLVDFVLDKLFKELILK